MDIYAPLAGRMGMQNMRDELEDIAFRELNPEANRTIAERLRKLHEESGDVLREIENGSPQRFAEDGIVAAVTGREKRPYSIWRKMERKQLSLGQLSDIFGFRVIVATVDECYRALGVVHRLGGGSRPVQGLHLEPEAERLPLDSHDGHRPASHARRDADPDQRPCTRSPSAGSRRTPSTRTFGNAEKATQWRQGAQCRIERLSLAAPSGRDALGRRQSRRSSSSTPSSNCFMTRSSASRPRATLIALPKGANADRLRLCRPHQLGDSCVGCRINGRHAR